jgi:hypothetical protein
MNTADKVIKYAWSQIGYLEKNSNKFLDDFKKNAGKRNYTKYAEEYKKATGLNFQAQAWCDVFVDTCFIATYGIKTAKMLLGNFQSYTPYSANEFKNMGSWYSKPCIGDIIFFKNAQRINHTGIVIDVNRSKVYTIEGNTSNGKEVIENGGAVCTKSYWLSNERIAGYGRPDYDNPYKRPLKTITSKSKENDIKWLQFQLNKSLKSFLGQDFLEVDGEYGNLTKRAAIKFYELQEWKSDGTAVGIYAIGRLAKY